MLKSQASVETKKASRYLKALCNHFNRKVTAEYDDAQGTVQFGFADCHMNANENTLLINIQAEDDENINRAKFVMSDHLIRFAPNEDLSVVWIDED